MTTRVLETGVGDRRPEVADSLTLTTPQDQEPLQRFRRGPSDTRSLWKRTDAHVLVSGISQDVNPSHG